MKMDIDQIKQTIYDIVVCIPEGCVTTYSDERRDNEPYAVVFLL